MNNFFFCKFLKEVKFPNGYSSNIARWVNLKNRKISGLKSHNFHILLEILLPLAIDGLLLEEVFALMSTPLIKLSSFFKALCSKVLSVDDLEKMEYQIVIALCLLERIFPPSFFWCYDAFTYSLSWWGYDFWTCLISVDVSNWNIFANIKKICS